MHSVTKAGNISSQYVGINTLRVWTQRVAAWLGLPNPNIILVCCVLFFYQLIFVFCRPFASCYCANFFINAGGSVDALMVEGCWASLNAVREYWRESNFRIRQAAAFISHSFDSTLKCSVAPVASHECISSDSDSCASDLPKKKLRSSSAPFVINIYASKAHVAPQTDPKQEKDDKEPRKKRDKKSSTHKKHKKLHKKTKHV